MTGIYRLYWEDQATPPHNSSNKSAPYQNKDGKESTH